MPIYARKPESNFKPAPEGLYQAVCCDVWEPFEEESPFSGKMVDKTRIVWQLEEINPDNGRPYEVSQIYTLSLHSKANLTKHLEAWRGRRFSKEELKEFDLEKLIGVNCQLQIIHNAKEGGEVYANVQAIVPVGKAMTKLRVSEGYVRRKDRSMDGKRHEDHDHAAASAGDDEVPF